jgi:ankyrin repeat protein
MSTLDPTTLDEVRYHFGVFPRDVRFMLVHIAQQVIYKNGQLSTLYYALELDGVGPFAAPVPGSEYKALAAAMADPIMKAVLTDQDNIVDNSDNLVVDRIGPTGQTPLKLAVLRDNAPLVRRLVELSADPNEVDEYGCTLLMYAAFTHRRFSGKALVDVGADTERANRWGVTARVYAEMEDNAALLACLASPTFEST